MTMTLADADECANDTATDAVHTILVLSDIHARNNYLRAIVDLVSSGRLERFGIRFDELWNLGDILDRGPDDPRTILETLERFDGPILHIHGNHELYDPCLDHLAQGPYGAGSAAMRTAIRTNREYEDIRAFVDAIMQAHVIAHEETPRRAIGYHGGPVAKGKVRNPAGIAGCWQRLTPRVASIVAAIRNGERKNPFGSAVPRAALNEFVVIPSRYGGWYSPRLAFQCCKELLHSQRFVSVSGHNHTEQLYSYNFDRQEDTSGSLRFDETSLACTTVEDATLRELEFGCEDALLISMRSSGGYKSDRAHAVILVLGWDPSEDRIFFLDVVPQA